MMSDQIAAPTQERALEPRNRLLASLPGNELLRLQPHLEAVPMASGSVIFEVDEPLKHVYFIETGVVSLVTAYNRVTVGVGTIGCEGVVGGGPLLLDGHTAFSRSRVLVPGFARTLKVSLFRNTLRKSPILRAACEAHTRRVFVQMLQAVPCSRLHTVEQRSARWLLMCADQTNGNAFRLSEQGLAEMLGVPLPRLTVLTRELQDAGLIRYDEGVVTVLDRRGLELAACECYQIIRDRHERRRERASD